MLMLEGLPQTLQTVLLLSQAHSQRPIADAQSLRAGLGDFYDAVQPSVPRQGGEKPSYILTGESHRQLVELFDAPSGVDDVGYTVTRTTASQEALTAQSQRVDEARSLLLRESQEHAQIFELVFDSLFFALSPEVAGGTTSHALGILWANPHPTWSDSDLVEFLIHEMTHTLIFLDEWRHGHYTDVEAIAERSNWALSAIRGNIRPLDKALHSLIVAVEMAMFRGEADQWLLSPVLHPPTDQLLRGAIECAEAILVSPARDAIMTPRAIELTETALSAASRCQKSFIAAGV